MLQIDPMLIVQARAVWEVIAAEPNPVWPGWNAADTPVLIYLPGQQDVLINHPNPPEGFNAYDGHAHWPGTRIFVHNGPTLIEWDGQNTTTQVNGITTLVIADTLSNRKQQVGGLLADPRPAEQKLADLSYAQLATDPYEQMALVVHEAFHVFQRRRAPGKHADERAVRLYPCLSAPNNIAVALEGQALADCLRATTAVTARAAAIRFLAVRMDRRQALAPAAIEYEDRNEFVEGLAKYTELKLFDVLQGLDPPVELWLAQGFGGFADLSAQRESRARQLARHTSGDVNVNNDPYGASPVRARLYYSGMAIAAALDRFDPGWKDRIFDPEASLTGLLSESVAPTAAELAAARQAAISGPEYATLVEAKARLAEEGLRDTERLVASITGGPNTAVLVDYSDLPEESVGLAFTPFGVRPVDKHRTVYTLAPIQASFGSPSNGFRQDVPRPTLEDREARTFQFPLTAVVDNEELAQLMRQQGRGPWVVEKLDLQLPGAQISGERAEVNYDEGGIRVRLLRSDGNTR